MPKLIIRKFNTASYCLCLREVRRKFSCVVFLVVVSEREDEIALFGRHHRHPEKTEIEFAIRNIAAISFAEPERYYTSR